MNLGYVRHILVVPFLAALVGCGEDIGGVRFASATGVVTYKGAPLAGAQVMAIPEKGPLAMGNTDTSGKFTLSTGARSGVAIGKIRVSVSVAESDSNSIETPSAAGNDPSNVSGAVQSMAKIVEAQKNKNKKPQSQSSSGLAKYADAAKSDLSYEIKPGSNDLKIELK